MSQISDVSIRPMRDDERQNVHAIMRRAFPLVQQWFFSWTPNVLVAERDGQLLGAIVLKLLTLPHNRKGGLVSFNGRRLWDWNKTVWAVLAIAAVAVFLV